MKAYRITTYQDRAGQWRWRMRASNGKIVADSAEGYTRRDSCERAAKRVQDTPTILVMGPGPTDGITGGETPKQLKATGMKVRGLERL